MIAVALHPAVVGAAKVGEKLAVEHHSKENGRPALTGFFGGRHGAAVMMALEIEGQGESSLAIHTGCLGNLQQLFGQGEMGVKASRLFGRIPVDTEFFAYAIDHSIEGHDAEDFKTILLNCGMREEQYASWRELGWVRD